MKSTQAQNISTIAMFNIKGPEIFTGIIDMKKFAFALLAAGALIAQTSCDSASKLAEDIDGSWSSAPEMLANTPDGLITGVDNFVFSKTASTSGTLMIATMISVNRELPLDNESTEPVSLTASAKATVQGTWTAADDDEIQLVIDPASIKIEIDPEGIVAVPTLITEVDAPTTDSIPPALAAALKKEILKVITAKYVGLNQMDDVEIKDGRMKYEIENTHYIMSLQTLD